MNDKPHTPDPDQLQQQLWEFVYDLLDEAETARMQELITSEPEVARRYSEVKQQSELLASAAKLEEAPVKLAPPAATSTASVKVSGGSAGRSHSFGNWCAALAASLLLAIVGYAYLQPQSPLNPKAVALQEKQLSETQPVVSVTAPHYVQAEADNQISVSVNTKQGEPRPAEIEYQLYSTLNGKQLMPTQKAETNALGVAQLNIPGSKLDGPARIELVASYAGGRSEHMSTHIELDQPTYSAHLSFDKPLYRPGETVRYRSLTLSRFGMKPIDMTTVEFEMLDPSGAAVPNSKISGVTEQGVGNGWFEIPYGTPGGTYKLVVRSPENVFPEQEREFQVRQYRPRQFKLELELVRDSYAPGEEVVADFAAWRSTGEPLGDTRVAVQATVDGTAIELPVAQGQTAADGTYRVKFKLPEQIETGAGVLVVRIDDGGTFEQISETIPINLGKVEVEFLPEGGDLAAGLPNRVYFNARDPSGEPVHIKGRILDSAGEVITTLETEHEGRGRFSFTPSAVDVYHLAIDSPAGVTSQPELPAARADLPLVLSSEEFAYESQAPLTLSLYTRQPKGRYVVAAMCRGAQVGQLPVAKPQLKKVKQAEGTPEHFHANLELPVSDAADGVIRLTVYDYAQNPPLPVAERLVYRRPHKKLNVRVGGHSESYTPGSNVKLTFTVTDESEQPAPAVLGVSVVADTLLNLADDKSATMNTYYFLATEIEKPEDVEDANFFLTADPKAPSALDLLLGVQGWRRFVGMPSAEFAFAGMPGEAIPPGAEAQLNGMGSDMLPEEQAKQAEQVARLVQLDGVAEAPLWLDNSATLARELVAAKSTFAVERVQYIRQLGLALAGAAVVVLLGMFVVAVARWSSGLVVWSPVALGAVACLALGLLWTRAYMEPGGELAFAPFSLDSEHLMVAMRGDEATDESRAMSSPAESMSQLEAGAAEEISELEKMRNNEDPLDMAAPNAFAADAPEMDLAFPAVEAPANFPAPQAAGLKGLAERLAAPAGALARPAEQPIRFGDEKNALGGRLLEGRAAKDEMFRGAAAGEPFADFEDDRFGNRRRDANGKRANVAREEQLRQRHLQLVQQQFPVRQYFHEHQSTDPNTREDFEESICWHPLLIVGDDGSQSISFELSDLLGAFKVQVDAHSPSVAYDSSVGRIGSGTGEIISRIPFQLEPKLPVEVTMGDRIDLPLAVINDSRNPLNVDLEVTVPELFSLTGDTRRQLTVTPGNPTREWFELNVTGQEGEAKLTFAGQSAGSSVTLRDSIDKVINVTPSGFPVEASYAGSLEGEQELTIDLPENWIPGSLEVTLKAFPSTLADMQKGIDSILREPSGCFEQTSSSNYPNIMALQYMQEHEVADPAFTRRAKDLLDRGYQKLISFESPEHGYEWFGGNPGHEALTAYGLMEFRDMEQVYNVDTGMVQRTADWLMSRTDADGSFKRNARALDSFGRAPQDTTDAYIVWALSEANQQNIQAPLQHVLKMASKSDDPYIVALAARSAFNANQEKAGLELLTSLTKLQQADGHLETQQGTITRSGGISMQVETTAIAAMAWMKHPSGSQSAQKAVQWITESRQGAGGFGSTQATIMALKALTEYSRSSRKTSSAGELIARVLPVKKAATSEASRSSEPAAAEASEPESSLPPTTLPESLEGATATEPSVPVADEPLVGPSPMPVPAEAKSTSEEPSSEKPAPAESQAVTKLVKFAAGNAEVIELQGLEAVMKAGKNELAINLTGDNQMPYVLDIRYRVAKPQTHAECPVRLTTKLSSNTVVMGESLTLAVSLENISGKGQPMTTAIMGIPAGLQVRKEQLDELKKADKFAYYELNAREVILYWRDLSPELTDANKLTFSLDLIGEIPGHYTGPASRVYLYYTAEQKQWLEPLVVDVTKP